MASSIAFLLFLPTAAVGLLVFETKYKCVKLNASDISEGTFYLKLSNAIEINNTNGSMGSSSICRPEEQRISNLDCMCGENLRNQQTEIQDRLNNACKYYEEQTSSPLQICEGALTRLGKCVTFESYSDDTNSTVVYNESSLMRIVNEINTILSGYFNILDRTLVGVYLPSEGHRCQCLVSILILHTTRAHTSLHCRPW